jgi:transcriptional regulator with XRE-family HTH domain
MEGRLGSAMPPSAGRRRLRTVLRREREAANMTQDHVAIAMDWSLSKVIRIESGAVNISTNDLRALLDLYSVDAPGRRAELIEMARAARRPPWWAEYRDVMTPAVTYYVELEASAAELRFFNNTLIPGLFQTEAYARAAILSSAPTGVSKQTIDEYLAVRMRRQVETLDQAVPPRIMVVLDEAAIRRQVGGASVLSKQLNHLIQLAHRPDLTIKVVTFASGAHAGPAGPYIIMDFSDPEEEKPVLFSEGAFHDELARERSDVIANYRQSFERLSAAAMDSDASIAFIRSAIDDLWR